MGAEEGTRGEGKDDRSRKGKKNEGGNADQKRDYWLKWQIALLLAQGNRRKSVPSDFIVSTAPDNAGHQQPPAQPGANRTADGPQQHPGSSFPT